MALYHRFGEQYSSLENQMRARFTATFPELAMGDFDQLLLSCRRDVDSSGRKSRYSYDERRWWAEKLTWETLWQHRDPFPGIKPASAGEMTELDLPRGHRRRGFYDGQSSRRGRGNGRTRRQFGGSGIATRGQATFDGRVDNRYGRASNQVNFNSSHFNHHETSPDIGHGQLIGFEVDTTRHNTSSLPTIAASATQLSTAETITANNIICLQCGIMGHPELDCPYKISIKQRTDYERHLICGTPGHKAFKFKSSNGCLDCKKDREGGPELKTKVEHSVMLATSNESQSTDGTESSGVVYKSGWEEPSYDELVARSKPRSFDGSVQAMTSALRSYNLDVRNNKGDMPEFEKGDEDAVHAGSVEDEEESLIQF